MLPQVKAGGQAAIQKKEENFLQTHISKVIASPSNGFLCRYLLIVDMLNEQPPSR